MSHLKVCLSTSFCYIYRLFLTHSSTIPLLLTVPPTLYNCFCFLFSTTCYFLTFPYFLILKIQVTNYLLGRISEELLHCQLFSGSYICLSLNTLPSAIFHFTTSSSLPFILFSETLMNCFQ